VRADPTYDWWRLSPPPLRHHQLHRFAREIFSFVGGALGLVTALLPCMRGTSLRSRVGNSARVGKHDDLILSICIALFLATNKHVTTVEPLEIYECLLPQFGRNRIILPLVVVQSHDQRRRLEGPRSGPFSLIRPPLDIAAWLVVEDQACGIRRLSTHRQTRLITSHVRMHF
jgi:hypothetical protein